jgi:hypothetical protein
LLKVLDISANELVAENKVTIHGSGSACLGLLMGVVDGGDEGFVVHGRSPAMMEARMQLLSTT